MIRKDGGARIFGCDMGKKTNHFWLPPFDTFRLKSTTTGTTHYPGFV